MLAYILRRLLLIVPTLVGIMVTNFVIIQGAPGGPVEQTLATEPVSSPRGIRKAVGDGSAVDIGASGVIVVRYAIQSFLFAILVIVLFAGGSYLQLFPLRGIVSDNWHELACPRLILDYL